MYEYIFFYNYLDIYCNIRIRVLEIFCLKIYLFKNKFEQCVYDVFFFIKGGVIILLIVIGQFDFFDGVIILSLVIYVILGLLVLIKVGYQGI